MHRGGAERHYGTMGIDWIKSLPVAEIAEADSTLFLWVTMPLLQEGLDTLRSWGFQYKTCAFTWVKRNKISDSWFWGMGHWTRSNAELCLLGVRGKPKRVSGGVHSVLDAPIMRHSQKPLEVQERIVALMGDLPRIQLFSRAYYPGWDVWGNEV
jgi:N6-adenosine-specific RNA methylase IME4